MPSASSRPSRSTSSPSSQSSASASAGRGHDHLRVKGAREHNLRNISVDIPRDSLVVFTGLSGSGKSSLAFDTIFAEGQRRYVESLSAYARQFLGQMDKPDVDFIEGLSPAVSIDQKSTNRNPRSTVGTITEVYDYLRLLFARAGRPHCPVCGEPVGRQTPQAIVDQLLELPDRTRFQVLAPVVRSRKGEYVDLFSDLQGKGYSRARVDGAVISLSEPPKLAKQKKHSIDVVVDRLVSRGGDPSAKQRLTDSVETALILADGVLIVEMVDLDEDDPQRERRFSERMACPNEHPLSMDEIEPRSFSFNSPFGACPACTGIGTELEVDPELLVPDEDKSIREGAILPWAQGSTSADYFLRVIGALAEDLKFSLDTPWHALPERAREALLEGQNHEVHVKYRNRYGRERSYSTGFEGVIPFVKRRHSETDSDWSRERYEGYMREVPCPVCKGARLKPESLAVTVGGQSIAAVCALPISDAAKFLPGVDFSPRERQIAEGIIKEVDARLGFLLDVGLDYLSLDRPAATLSGGEAQRIRLATQIGSGLVGVLYVLDEPSIGLHQRDNHRLIETLTRLRDLGNTLIVVEHDEDTISMADYVVDIGPGAGEHGGHVVHAGSVAGLLANKKSITGDYLADGEHIGVGRALQGFGVYLDRSARGAFEVFNSCQEVPVDHLADGDDHRVAGEDLFGAFHILRVEAALGVNQRGDFLGLDAGDAFLAQDFNRQALRPQLDAFQDSLFNLVLVGVHLGAGFAEDAVNGLGGERQRPGDVGHGVVLRLRQGRQAGNDGRSHRHTDYVHRDVAAADHDAFLADMILVAEIDFAQQVNADMDAFFVRAGDGQGPSHHEARRDDKRLVAFFAQLGNGDILADGDVQLQVHAEFADGGVFQVHEFPRQAVDGNPGRHLAAGDGQFFKDGDAVAEAR